MEYLWLDVAFAWSEETIWEGWTPLQGAHGFWGLQPFVKKPFMNLVFLSFSFDSVVYSIHGFWGLQLSYVPCGVNMSWSVYKEKIILVPTILFWALLVVWLFRYWS